MFDVICWFCPHQGGRGHQVITDTTNWSTERGDTFVRHTPDVKPVSPSREGSSSSSSSSSSTNRTTSTSGVSIQHVPAPRPTLPKGTHSLVFSYAVNIRVLFSIIFTSRCMQRQDRAIFPFTKQCSHPQQTECS